MVGTETEHEIARLKRRLAAHRRRLNYWSGVPFKAGPTGKQLSKQDENYELACDDACNIAAQLAELGCPVRVVDVKRTFQTRYNDTSAPEITIWPEKQANR